MRGLVVLGLTAALTLAACQKTDTPFRKDIENICEAELRSGSYDRAEGERMLVVAQWLGGMIKTQEAREFLGRLAQAGPADKARLLDEVAKQVDLRRCSLARTWAAEAERVAGEN